MMWWLTCNTTKRRLYARAATAFIFIAIVILMPLLMRVDPLEQDIRSRLQPPGTRLPSGRIALLGTDQVGRDVLGRILYGSRVSLVIGASSVFLAGAIGIVLGLLGGYYGGKVDMVIMRIVDLQLAFPPLLLAIALVAAIGPSFRNIIVTLGITGWVSYCRVIRGSVLSVKDSEFVQAAVALGAGDLRIIVRHVLPNVVAPVLIMGTLQVGQMVIAESALSFLGVGIQPPTPSWGSMISDGRPYLYNAWWVATFPGVAIALTVMTVGLLGDALRDYLDPKFRGDQ